MPATSHKTRRFRATLLTIALMIPLAAGPSCGGKSKSSKKESDTASQNGTKSKTNAVRSKTSGRTAPEASSGIKDPDRELPRLSKSVEDSIRSLVSEAKTNYNRAIKANELSPPDKETFFSALNVCKEKLDEADLKLEPVTLWEEESTMERWRVSASERAYLETMGPLLSKIDKMRAAAEKISRAR